MPACEIEHALRRQGYACIGGVDEVGRGCWAGPVVAAAVVLGDEALARPELLQGIDDSKRLAPHVREALLPRVAALASGIGIGVVPAFLIDTLGIVRATRLAMELAVLQLPRLPDALIVDALHLPGLPVAQTSLNGADHLSFSVAAASIVAKTARDRRMAALEQRSPRYGYARHKGYGTPEHRAALRRWGPSDEHRRSFRPLWNMEDA